MTEPLRYSLTRVCLRRGTLTLPRPLWDAFPDAGTVHAEDAETGETFELWVEAPRTVHGLGAFFEAHDLQVNDQLGVRVGEDGRVTLTAQPRVRRTRVDRAAVERAVRAVREGDAVGTERELRAAHGLGADAPLERALQAEPAVERRAGRWSARKDASTEGARGPEAAARRAAPASDSTLEGLSRARDAFTGLGYEVESLGEDQLRLRADMGRSHYDVLLQVLRAREADWRALLARQRELGATYLAAVGPAERVGALEREAAGARASLWSWEGLERALALAQTVLIGPLDLEGAFAGPGLHGAGLERFEAGQGERVAAQGAFSDVLVRLASLRAPAVFVLDDVTGGDGGTSREAVAGILERLSVPPFGLVTHRGHGEYALRYPVPEALTHLSRFAEALRERLPDRRRSPVRAEAPEPLGPDELAALLEEG